MTTPATPTPTPTPPTGGGSNSCPSVTLAEDVGPSTGVAPLPPSAMDPPPHPGSTSNGSICVTSPADGASVSSPVHVQAAASLINPIYFMRTYVDGEAQYFDWYNTMDAYLWLAPGSHTIELLANDISNNQVSTTFTVNVSSQQPAPVTQIQTLPLWDGCSAKFPPGHPRAGQLCAAGRGTAVAAFTENQGSPSMSGHSAKVTLAGPAQYSNMLWTKYLGGGAAPSHFVYDLYFYIDHPENAQALEFDNNQGFGGQRWIFGTECNLKGDGVWDVWNGAPNTGWQPTSVPCTSWPANTWNHLVWTFERVGEQVHYVSVQVNGTTYPLDIYYSNQSTWDFEGIDVAFQMDGDYRQAPYTVWLDNVTLTAY